MQKTFRDINRHQFRIHVLLFDSFCFRPLSYFSPQNIMQDEKPKVAQKDVLVNSMQRIWRAPVIFLAWGKSKCNFPKLRMRIKDLRKLKKNRSSIVTYSDFYSQREQLGLPVKNTLNFRYDTRFHSYSFSIDINCSRSVNGIHAE